MEPFGIEDVAQQLVYLRGADIAEDGANIELDELCRLDLEARSLGECHRGGGVDRRPAGDARIEHSVLGKERRDSVPVWGVAPLVPLAGMWSFQTLEKTRTSRCTSMRVMPRSSTCMKKGGGQVGAGDISDDAHNRKTDGFGQRCGGHDERKGQGARARCRVRQSPSPLHHSAELRSMRCREKERQGELSSVTHVQCVDPNHLVNEERVGRQTSHSGERGPHAVGSVLFLQHQPAAGVLARCPKFG